MTPVELQAITARTRVAARDNAGPLVSDLGADGFAWLRGDEGFVTSGVVARVAAGDAARALDAIDVDDDVRVAGSGAIAVGALPFVASPDDQLVIPARVVGRTADGTTWITELYAAGPDAANGDSETRVADTQDAVPEQPGDASRVRAPDTPGTWAAKVRAALARIESGALRKVVLAREVEITNRTPFDRRLVLTRLLTGQPGCIVYAAPGFVGASPELLVERHGARVVSRPMAGTVANGLGDAEDAAASAALAHSTKDALEHRLVVDDVVATLERLCDDVRAAAAPEVVPFASVAHLTTTITAVVRDPRTTALDLARALHPTPAVGGTPTAAACAALRELEGFDRGRYAGPVGWVDARGDGEWAVALRGAELSGNRARVVVGAGIVSGSDPATEWAETEAKLVGIRAALLG